MSAPPLRVTESVMSSTTCLATTVSIARPMRASWNMECTAPVACLHMAAALANSLSEVTLITGTWAGLSYLTTCSMASACSSTVGSGSVGAAAVLAGVSIPLSVSIITSRTLLARILSRSLGSVMTNWPRQKGWSIQEPQNSLMCMPNCTSSTLIFFSMAVWLT